MKGIKQLAFLGITSLVLGSCTDTTFTAERKMVKLNNEYYPALTPMNDNNEDEMNVNRGFIKGTELTEPMKMQGTDIVSWDINQYIDHMHGDAPATVHPNLWRMEKMNNCNGLYQVYPKPEEGDELKNGIVYQIRTYDISTMSIIKGKKGWIIIDPLNSADAARKGWEIFKANIDPDAKLRAVIISHSHVDHYMGLNGVVDPANILRTTQEKYSDRLLDDGKVLVLAPNGFYEEAISENLYLSSSMGRRSNYMYGMYLPVDECGSIGAGLGKNVSYSSGTLNQPSFELKANKDKMAHLTIDGLSFTFLDTPNTEAPAEFHIFLDDYKILCPGENISYTMHNLLTPRGAKVRDSKAFGKAIDKSMDIIQENWGGDINAIIGVHHWPTWGKEPCFTLMEKQRDMYYFFNDQVIRLMNKGMNMEEIAEMFRLPSTLSCEYYNRGYYGTLNHNVKAVFQRYAGWWDGNPANYFKYPDEEVAKRMVEDMGGERALLKKAKKYFDKGDYRWTIELTRHLVFYNPKNEQARYLQADAFEQLAYACEAGTWRNIFLSAAFELRHIKQSLFKGTPEEFIARTARSLGALPCHYMFEYYSVLLDGFKADGVDRVWNVKIGNELHELTLKNGVLHHKEVAKAEGEVIAFATKADFIKDFHANMTAALKGGEAHSAMYELYQYFDTFNLAWNIIEPLSEN